MIINENLASYQSQLQLSKRDIASFTGNSASSMQSDPMQKDSKEVRQIQNQQLRNRFLNNLSFKGHTENVTRGNTDYQPGTSGSTVSATVGIPEVRDSLKLETNRYNIEGKSICVKGHSKSGPASVEAKASVYVADPGEVISEKIRKEHDFIVTHKKEFIEAEKQRKAELELEKTTPKDLSKCKSKQEKFDVATQNYQITKNNLKESQVKHDINRKELDESLKQLDIAQSKAAEAKGKFEITAKEVKAQEQEVEKAKQAMEKTKIELDSEKHQEIIKQKKQALEAKRLEMQELEAELERLQKG